MKKKYAFLATITTSLMLALSAQAATEGATDVVTPEAVSGSVSALQDDTFGDFLNKGYVVIDFYSDSCPPCRRLAPIFEKVSNQMGNKAAFGKVKVTEATQTAKAHGVKSIPCVVVFNKGKELGRNVGFLNEQELTTFINHYVK